MNIYIFNLLSIVFYSYFYSLFKDKSKEKRIIKKIFVILFTIQLFLFLSLRDTSVGIDVNRYVEHFHYISRSSLPEFLLHRHEIGYKTLTKLITFFTENQQVFLTIIASISVFPVGKFIYKYSNMPFLSFALYISFNFYAFTFSGLRQAIAFSIILISFDYLISRKPFRFFLTVIVATLFHKSAIFFLPAYVLTKIKLNKKNLLLILTSFIIVFIFRVRIMEFMTLYLFDSYEIVESGSFQWLLFNALVYCFCLFLYKKTINNRKQNNILYILVGVGIYLMIFASVATNAMRIANYYFVFIILLIPEVLLGIQKKQKRWFFWYIFIIVILFLTIWFSYQDGYNVIPYRPFWSF